MSGVFLVHPEYWYMVIASRVASLNQLCNFFVQTIFILAFLSTSIS